MSERAPKRGRPTKRSLLERVQAAEQTIPAETERNKEQLLEECEVAISYLMGRVYGASISRALKIKPGQVPPWAISVVAKGVRRGIVKLELFPEGYNRAEPVVRKPRAKSRDDGDSFSRVNDASQGSPDGETPQAERKSDA